MKFFDNPIIIIEDDAQDREILALAFKKADITEKLLFFKDGESFLYWADNNQLVIPLLIISDFNMPGMNALGLKAKIEKRPGLKNMRIPFVIMSGSESQKELEEAFQNSVQGFFIKKVSFSQTQELLKTIVNYWKSCSHPCRKMNLISN